MGRGRIAESAALEAAVPGRRTPLNADPLGRSSDNVVSEGPLLAESGHLNTDCIRHDLIVIYSLGDIINC